MSTDTLRDTELIERWIVEDPWHRGPADVKTTEGVHVWALIGYLPAVNNDVERVAHDYDLPVEAVEAAIAYYRAHREVIDGRLAANDAWVP